MGYFCNSNVFSRINLATECEGTNISNSCEGNILESFDSCVVHKIKNVIFTSSLFDIQVIDLSLHPTRPKSMKVVRKILQPGVNMYNPGNITNFRVICNNTFIDYDYTHHPTLHLLEIVVHNLTYSNLDVLNPIALNTSNMKLTQTVKLLKQKNDIKYYTLVVITIVLFGLVMYIGFHNQILNFFKVNCICMYPKRTSVSTQVVFEKHLKNKSIMVNRTDSD